ncbi:uncharacterized protein LOC126671808 [Mercurialis annua]|uniref:uncharacterized protein LOC126671808 n=1 Tax=Mercurialis annua TaxID=3986 RepID=UPI0024ADA800|nr:uncharacterized protein LOC126671808 [Mercurialis annua]
MVLKSVSKHNKKVTPRKDEVSAKRKDGNRAGLRSNSKKTLTDIDNQPKIWQYAIPVDEWFVAKVQTTLNHDPILKLKTKLNDVELDLFRKSPFGYFLDMPVFKVQTQVLHFLLLRLLNQPNANELWFNIGGVRLKFGIDEFALVTGLKCHGDISKLRFRNTSDGIFDKYFKDLSCFNKQALEDFFVTRRWSSPEDGVKIAILYFLDVFLFSSQNVKRVSIVNLNIIESSECNEFPWGLDCFNCGIDDLKDKLKGKSKQYEEEGKTPFYRLAVFIYALQCWFYECCPVAVNNLAILENGDAIPRILRWKVDDNPGVAELEKPFFSLSGKQMKLRKITPSGKDKKKEVSENLSDSEDDKAEYQGGEASSSALPKKRLHLDHFEKELQTVVSSQNKIVEDLNCFKDYVTLQFTNLFKVLDSIKKSSNVIEEQTNLHNGASISDNGSDDKEEDILFKVINRNIVQPIVEKKNNLAEDDTAVENKKEVEQQDQTNLSQVDEAANEFDKVSSDEVEPEIVKAAECNIDKTMRYR